MSIKTLIGLEIHVELSTQTKMFCGCKNVFGAPPNTHVCEICLGYPGTLPTMNKKAVEYAIKAGLAFNCGIEREVRMDRKKYFYPDLVKGYQISQDGDPLCYDGYIEVNTKEYTKRIGIQRIHIEEDTGKSIHTEDGHTLMDYDRSGVPLIEVVTYPDMTTAEEAQLFLSNLRETLKHIGVSDVKMEEGSLRCDVNINVVDSERGIKTAISEIKNMNSFKAVGKAIEYEEKRHRELLESNGESRKETRRWDDLTGTTQRMRFKEQGADYRYSAEGDLPVLYIDEAWVEALRGELPELPQEKASRFQREYGLDEYDANVLSKNQALSDFFEEVSGSTGEPKLSANWVMGDVLRRLNEEELDAADMVLAPKTLAVLINYVKDQKINQNTAKKLLREVFAQEADIEGLIQERGLIQIQDTDALATIVDEVLAQNEQSVVDFRNGKDRALGFLVGQCMKASRGKGNPQRFNELLLEKMKG
ncbi:MAG: Asp-tRNA(Asn)/Glu-tRNA(Gln) amidotransferase subunit GatB [Tissierellia bacterium]|nr:Asp-tRNA(Asn)/Glu-tRNA(Gln) amidotransferase subunit GatB [Tissierellia bacterium]